MATKKSDVNKSDFIRRHPTLKAGDLVKKAKQEGIVISEGLIYSVRSSLKAKNNNARPPATQRVRAASASTASSQGSLDAMVRAIVVDEIRKFFANR